MIGYLKEFDDSMTTSLRVDDSKLFKKYCKMWKMLNSVVKVGRKYYPKVFLEECKYGKRKNKMFNYINDDFEMTSSDENDYFYSESDNDSNN